MTGLRIAFSALALALVAGVAAAQDSCPEPGVVRGVSGKIFAVDQFDDYWTMLPGADPVFVNANCEIIEIQGDGPLPDNCVEGAGFSATGELAHSFMTAGTCDGDCIGLYASTISCY